MMLQSVGGLAVIANIAPAGVESVDVEGRKAVVDLRDGSNSLMNMAEKPIITSDAGTGEARMVGLRRRGIPRVPSLAGMRAFDTLAKLGSITKAAEVLCVTPAAVKHRISELELELGVKLFEREGNRLKLTAAGRVGLKEIADSFTRISSAFEAIRAYAANDLQISIAAPVSIILEWLIPRLEDIKANTAHFQVLFEACDHPTEHASFHPDLMIADSDAAPDARNWVPLLQETVVPFASPQYVKNHSIQGVEQIASCDLIELVWPESLFGYVSTWQNWFTRTSQTVKDLNPRFKVTHSSLALALAEKGEGIALVGRHTAEQAVREGRVVALVEEGIPGVAWWALNAASGQKQVIVTRVIEILRQPMLPKG